MTAKEYLNRYRAINAEIDLKLEQIARLRDIATKLSPTARFDSNGNVSDRVGRTVAKIVDLEREIDREIDCLIETGDDIKSTLSRVKDNDMRAVLEMRYINRYSWQKIALKMNYSKDHLTGYLHRKALKVVDDIISQNDVNTF